MEFSKRQIRDTASIAYWTTSHKDMILQRQILMLEIKLRRSQMLLDKIVEHIHKIHKIDELKFIVGTQFNN
jgi:hypothetical protein